MGLISGIEILKESQSRKYAVGGFDIFNLESAQAVLYAAEELNSPVFLQVCIASAEHMGVSIAGQILKEILQNASVPGTIHLDHGPEGSNLSLIKEAVDAGFTSVMVDGSRFSLKENIEWTKEAVKFAHSKGVCVEGELGQVSRNINATEEEIRGLMTNPDEAGEYVRSTGVDYLSVSVGSVSGFFRGKPNIDLRRLKQIREAVTVPLVLHGGTSLPAEIVGKVIELGVCKINVAHGLRKVFVDAIYEELQKNPEQIDPRPVLNKARIRMKDFVKEKIKLFRKDGI